MPEPATIPAALRALVLAASLALASPSAAQQLVEVVNPPSAPVPVSVENGALTVVVDNTANEAIPVSLDPGQSVPVVVEADAPEVPILISFFEWRFTLGSDVMRIEDVHEVCIGRQPVCTEPNGHFQVPQDKVLVIESVTTSVRLTNGTAPGLMAADIAIQPPGADEFVFSMGIADYVHPQSKTWQTSFTGKLRAPAGSRVRGGVFWDAVVGGASGSFWISGVLQDAPEVVDSMAGISAVDHELTELGTMQTAAERADKADLLVQESPATSPTLR